MLQINETTKLHFLYKFIHSPRQIGSVIPSSSYLVHKMLDQIDWGKIKTVAELGAGTGVFTKSILDRKNKETTIVIYEHDGELRKKLNIQFPEVLSCEDAFELKSSAHELGIKKYDCIISGLPLSNFTESSRVAMFEQISELLSDDGIFIAFQYSLRLKKMFRAYFDYVEVSFEPFNFPPAFIFMCKKGVIDDGD